MPTTRDSVFERLAALPWPAGLAIAALLYLMMAHIAPRLLNGDPDTRIIGETLALLAPLLAGVFVLLSVLSFACWLVKRRRQHDRAPIAAIRRLDRAEFEHAVAEAFRHEGYLVDTNPVADGVDLILRRHGREYYLQYHHWRAPRVETDAVRRFCATITAAGAAGGIMLSAGQFSDSARAWAAAARLRLIGGDELVSLIAGPVSSRRKDSSC